MNKVNNEAAAGYNISVSVDDQVINEALAILEARMKGKGLGQAFTQIQDGKDFFRLKLSELQSEEFHVLFLDNQNRLIKHEVMFYGTINATSVYPREVVKAALKHNAVALILAHNHPSGDYEPSSADRCITEKLKSSLDLIDVRL